MHKEVHMCLCLCVNLLDGMASNSVWSTGSFMNA